MFPQTAHAATAEPTSLRVATFNVSLYGDEAGATLRRLQGGADPQAQRLAEIIQRVRPDILLLNEIDYDPRGELLALFLDAYLAKPQHASGDPAGPSQPIRFAYRFQAPVNTGRPSGFDLNRDGLAAAQENSRPGSDAYASDCWGYGRYPGQYAMAIVSQYPIDTSATRTFQHFRWIDLPGARLPEQVDAGSAATRETTLATSSPETSMPETCLAEHRTDREAPTGRQGWYAPEAVAQFPLSSKSHWDVPVRIGAEVVHILASHPTPPVFDGPEDRNGLRNRDEIRFWNVYLGDEPEGEQGGQVIYDDRDVHGGLAPDSAYVIVGDLNADPCDGESTAAIAALLELTGASSRCPPSSGGGPAAAWRQGGANLSQTGDPRYDTLDATDDPGPGNLRVDYVLPSSRLQILDSGVFWPLAEDPLFPLVGDGGSLSSDHRLVWVDVAWPPPTAAPPSS